MTAGPGKSQQVGLKTTSTWLKTANTNGSASAILAWKGLNLGPTLAKNGSWAQEAHRHSASPEMATNMAQVDPQKSQVIYLGFQLCRDKEHSVLQCLDMTPTCRCQVGLLLGAARAQVNPNQFCGLNVTG